MSDWERRWREGRIGFHQDRPSWALVRFGPELFRPEAGRVLVPLAGKSLDMRWLADRGHAVLGVELVERAVAAFFEEAGYAPQVRALPSGRGTSYQHGRLELLAADIFDVGPEEAGRLGGAFDRAALIALPERDRRRYVPHVTSLLAPGAALLLVSLDYDEGAMEGPPFRVPDPEVEALFAGLGTLEKVEERDALAESPRFRERGLSRLTESVFVFRKPGDAEAGPPRGPAPGTTT